MHLIVHGEAPWFGFTERQTWRYMHDTTARSRPTQPLNARQHRAGREDAWRPKVKARSERPGKPRTLGAAASQHKLVVNGR